MASSLIASYLAAVAKKHHIISRTLHGVLYNTPLHYTIQYTMHPSLCPSLSILLALYLPPSLSFSPSIFLIPYRLRELEALRFGFSFEDHLESFQAILITEAEPQRLKLTGTMRNIEGEIEREEDKRARRIEREGHREGVWYIAWCIVWCIVYDVMYGVWHDHDL